MVEISKEVFEIVNKPGRVGVLGTADKQGQPNTAYFGSLRLMEDGSVVLGLGKNRSLKNLEENPLAVLFCDCRACRRRRGKNDRSSRRFQGNRYPKTCGLAGVVTISGPVIHYQLLANAGG